MDSVQKLARHQSTKQHLDRTEVIPTYKGPLHIFAYNYIFHAPASNNVFITITFYNNIDNYYFFEII